MIRFIDLTKDYFCSDDPEECLPLCAFINTTSNLFYTSGDGTHVFHDLDEILELDESIKHRCMRLVPPHFFKD